VLWAFRRVPRITRQRPSIYGLTVSVVCTDTAPVVAVITTGVELETENVGTLKVVLFEPAGTLTLAGTATALLLLAVNGFYVYHDKCRRAFWQNVEPRTPQCGPAPTAHPR
jgi:hypothetical protein